MTMKISRESGLTRRKLLFTAGALGLTLFLPRRRIHAAPSQQPRFLLHIQATGGLDPTMLFDARPLAMTAAGKIHNPLGEDPIAWVGSNGQQALTMSTTAPLQALRERFSVINGVVMSTSFDGHDQNTNLFLAGTPFGGTSFNAELNADSAAPLDYIRIGTVLADLQDGRAVQLTPSGLKQLVGGVGALAGIAPSVDDFLRGEGTALGDPNDRFGAGVLGLAAANTSSTDLQQKIKAIQLGNETDPLDARLGVIREVFRHGIARGAMFGIDDILFDTHAPAAATGQAPGYRELSSRLARVFTYLAATPFDDQLSLLDVTTVVIGSEFGRTMRQQGLPIDNTGTDHNPLSSTVLIGGSGIKSGLVVGASDFQVANETLSATHLAFDPAAVKVMGRPFDFTSGEVRNDRPAAFVAGDYLQIASVINTVYSLFDIDRAKWRLVERNGEVAPVLSTLLA
jgi:hypothetical protein